MAKGDKEEDGIEAIARQLESFGAAREPPVMPPVTEAKAPNARITGAPELLPIDEVTARFEIVIPFAKMYKVKNPAEADWLVIGKGRELSEDERARVNSLAEQGSLPYRIIEYGKGGQGGQAIFFFNKTGYSTPKEKENLLRRLKGESGLETTVQAEKAPQALTGEKTYASATPQPQSQPQPGNATPKSVVPTAAEISTRPSEQPTASIGEELYHQAQGELEIVTTQTTVTVYERQPHRFGFPSLTNGILAVLGINGYRVSIEDPSQVVFTGQEYLSPPNAPAMQNEAVKGLLAMEKRMNLYTAGELERLVQAAEKSPNSGEALRTLSSYFTGQQEPQRSRPQGSQ